MTGPTRKRWATALAYAFLDGDWSEEGLIRRGTIVLGHSRTEMRALIRDVVNAYHRPPSDRVRELASWLTADSSLDAALSHVKSSAPARWLPFQPAMGDMPWPVPAIPTVGELSHFCDLSVSELAWFADARSLERRVADEKLRHYRYRWVRKSGGGLRLIESPKTRLRNLQRHLLATILNRIPPHDSAHGFVTGRSVLTFVRNHAHADVVLRLDLHDFFGSINAGRVYGVFRTAGYPESVAHALTGLTTNSMPNAVWSDAPRPAQASALNEHFMFGKRLALPHLPQGAPTSPALANLCAHGLDRRLAGLAASFGLRYSRYADDLAFSGSLNHAAVERVLAMAGDIAGEEGFRVNERKTVVMGKGHRQRLAGAVINRVPNLDRTSYDTLRAMLHNAATSGLDTQNRLGQARFAEHLSGRVSWAVGLNPNRAKKLMPLLSAATQPKESP